VRWPDAGAVRIAADAVSEAGAISSHRNQYSNWLTTPSNKDDPKLALTALICDYLTARHLGHCTYRKGSGIDIANLACLARRAGKNLPVGLNQILLGFRIKRFFDPVFQCPMNPVTIRVRTILVLGYRVLANTGQHWCGSGIWRYFFDCETRYRLPISLTPPAAV